RFGSFALVLALFPTRRVVPRVAFWLLVAFGYFVAGPSRLGTVPVVLLQLGTLAGFALAQLSHYSRATSQAHPRHTPWAIVGITVWIGLAAALLVAAPLGRSLALLVWYGTVSGLAVTQLARYWRVADPVQRQQTKWATFGLSTFTALGAVLLAPALFMPSL